MSCLSDCRGPQPSPHFSYSEINALPLNGQQAVTAISALWLRRSTAFRWLQQPIGRHLMIDVVEQVIERHQEVKNEGISELHMTSRTLRRRLDAEEISFSAIVDDVRRSLTTEYL